MKRRSVIIYLGLTLLMAQRSLGKNSGQSDPDTDWKNFLNPSNGEPIRVFPKISLSSAEWKKKLPELQYKILFEEHTEPRFSSPLNNEKRRGLYHCRACGLALFTSQMKYDSKTGWPSFFTSIPGHLGTKKDFRLFIPRTEYHCNKCGGHQGHVFQDGPAPTYERWCNNGLSLVFKESA